MAKQRKIWKTLSIEDNIKNIIDNIAKNEQTTQNEIVKEAMALLIETKYKTKEVEPKV